MTDSPAAAKDRASALGPARAGKTGVFGCLSALHAHTKAPYKMDLHRKMLMALNRPRDGADSKEHAGVVADDLGDGHLALAARKVSGRL